MFQTFGRTNFLWFLLCASPVEMKAAGNGRMDSRVTFVPLCSVDRISAECERTSALYFEYSWKLFSMRSSRWQQEPLTKAHGTETRTQETKHEKINQLMPYLPVGKSKSEVCCSSEANYVEVSPTEHPSVMNICSLFLGSWALPYQTILLQGYYLSFSVSIFPERNTKKMACLWIVSEFLNFGWIDLGSRPM